MDNLCDRYILVQSALAYLDQSDRLQNVKNTCLKYRTGEELIVYHFKLLVDPAELTELNALLGNLVIVKPLEAADIFQEVVFQSVQELELLPGDTTLSQVAVVLKLENLPNPLESCRISCVKDFSRCLGKFCYVKFDGVITGITGISKYTKSTKYVCPFKECEGNEGNRFIRVHISGASETETIRNDFTCSICGSVLEEDKSSRIISDKLLAEVVPESCFREEVNFVKLRIQSIPVYVRDELCEKIRMGQKYHIIGTVKKVVVGEQVSLALEANNTIEFPFPFQLKCFSSLPRNIVHLFNDRKHSPWSFSLSLAYLFGGEILPPGTYLRFKLGLILSLAAASEGLPLHLLAVGSDAEGLGRLMKYSLQFSERSVCHMVGSHLTGKVINDRHETAPYFMEGGSLLLASGGICYIGDVGRFRKKDVETLSAVLNSNKVYLDLGSKHTGGLPQQTVHPVRCQVWAYTDNTTVKTSKSDSFLHHDLGNVPKQMLDGFNCVFYTDADDLSTREEADTQTACQVLVQAMELKTTTEGVPISAHDFFQLFQYVSTVKTSLTKESYQLLQLYYLASRKARTSSDSSSEIPGSAFQSLTSLAHAHAKISLRGEVLEEDAVIAIKIYEEYLTARFVSRKMVPEAGISVLNVQPVSHVPSSSFDQYLDPENDKAMHHFHVQLLRFCGRAAHMEE